MTTGCRQCHQLNLGDVDCLIGPVYNRGPCAKESTLYAGGTVHDTFERLAGVASGSD